LVRPRRFPALFVTVALVAFAHPSSNSTPPCLARPVPGPVVEPFEQPPCPWCPGNVSVDLASSAGESVVAPVSGVVSFAGQVAGIGYVSIESTSWEGHTATVGAVRPEVRVGDHLLVGRRLGTATGEWVGLSLRRTEPAGPVYLDPVARFGRWVGRARLVPRDGTAWTRPRARVTCSGAR